MLDVTCAIIEKDDKVLCAQRSAQMSHALKWEFPGGKLEPGETLAACLKREIKEELGLDIAIWKQLPASKHTYNLTKEICLHPFICTIQAGTINLKEHKQIVWLTLNELKALDWVEADVPALRYYLSQNRV